MGVSGWHMELCAVGILYREHLGALAVHEDFGRADEPADAIVDMHYIFAGVKFVEVAESCASCERGISKMRLPLGKHSVGLGDNEECLLACGVSAWCEFEAA